MVPSLDQALIFMSQCRYDLRLLTEIKLQQGSLVPLNICSCALCKALSAISISHLTGLNVFVNQVHILVLRLAVLVTLCQ